MEYMDIGILALTCIIDTYLIHDYLSTCFEYRYYLQEHKYYIMTAATAISGCCLIVNMYGNREINFVATIILLFVYVYAIFEGRIYEKLIHFVIAYLIMVGCEMLIGILVSIGTEDYKKLSGIPQIEIIVLLLTYIVLQIAKRFGKRTKRQLSTKLLSVFLVIPISCLLLMMVVFYTYAQVEMGRKTNLLIILAYVFILLCNIWIYYFFCEYYYQMENNNEKELMILKQKSELQYYKGISESIDDYTEFIHNTRQFYESLQVMMKEEDYENAYKFLEKVVETSDVKAVKTYSNNRILNIILSDKENKAKKYGTYLNVFVEPDIDVDMVSEMDMVAMIGNLLDNAIEAASSCVDEKRIDVWLYMHNNGSFFVTKVINHYVGEIKKDGDRILTSKKDEHIHGKGLASVNRQAEKYGGFLSCEYDATTFKSILLLGTKRLVS